MPTDDKPTRILADEPDGVDFERFLTDPDPMLAAEGWRLRVCMEAGSANVLVERERVWPERINDPSAKAVLEARSFGWMSAAETVWLRDLLTEILDAPRRAARANLATLTTIAGNRDPWLLVRTTEGEWGVLECPDDAEDAWASEVWFAPDREHDARTLYASERGKALCVCGVECDEAEIDRSDDEPMCPGCVKAAQEEFLAADVACVGTPFSDGCGWSGKGAEANGDACPKCKGDVEEIETTQPEATK